MALLMTAEVIRLGVDDSSPPGPPPSKLCDAALKPTAPPEPVVEDVVEVEELRRGLGAVGGSVRRGCRSRCRPT